MSITPLAALSRLRRARLEAGRSLEQVGHATGVSATKLSLAERGLVQLTRPEQRAVSNALGVAPGTLFGADTPRPTSVSARGNMNTLLRSALAYASRGLPVFPVYEVDVEGRCACGTKCGRDAGKHPRIRRGFRAATCDERTIRAWWSKFPKANIGIATGNGIAVVDVDMHGER